MNLFFFHHKPYIYLFKIKRPFITVVHTLRSSVFTSCSQLSITPPSSTQPAKKKAHSSNIMSHSHPSTTSSNFQLILNNALKVYKKRTKKDLLVHPLATQLESCNSPSAILALLQREVLAIDQTRSSDGRWTKWLDPTVNVLFILSETLGEGISLVNHRKLTCLGPAVSHLLDRYFHQQRRFL